MTRVGITFLVMVLTTGTVAAQTPTCETLDERQGRLAVKILASEYLWDCCDDTISSCLEAQPTCRLAARIAENVCRRIAVGQDETGIRRALSRRARSMMGGGVPPEIDSSNTPLFGSAEAPVTVVIYACARCPYCSKLIPLLYDAVGDGALQDDAQLAFRIFPIRGHEGSTEASLGLAAAVTMDGFWPYLLESYRNFGEYSAERQIEWAAAVGLDREIFSARVHDPSTREALISSKKEGLVNGVEETPTIFLNQRRWVGDLTIEELVDAIEEEAERVRGDQWATD